MYTGKKFDNNNQIFFVFVIFKVTNWINSLNGNALVSSSQMVWFFEKLYIKINKGGLNLKFKNNMKHTEYSKP